MKKQKLDCGLREFSLAGGVLRCNPTDPNLYARFLEAAPAFMELERQLEQAKGDILPVLQRADCRLKAQLSRIFPGNDFEELLMGINLLAVGENGQRVITNLLEMLEPVFREGAESFARAETEKALEKARMRRGGSV